jgi:hypothetical protein
METQNLQKNAKKYVCELCAFTSSNKNNYTLHLSTGKHLANIKGDGGDCKPATFNCTLCKKQYNSRNGLWKHAKKCIMPSNTDNIIICDSLNIEDPEAIQLHISETSSSNENKVLNIVLELMKSNNELQKQILDVCKNTSNINNINNNNNNNNHNKTFNLQFFLNEQCKDAMNITDFANSFDLQLSDLESVGELGYVDGITKIIVDKLNAMDVYKRPMHCSDAKREIIYVKDENVWAKEEKNNPKLRQAIKNISFRNMKLVYNWSNEYPESKDNQTKLNDKYMTLVIESTGGKGPILESENKIMRKIVKEIIIDKQ